MIEKHCDRCGEKIPLILEIPNQRQKKPVQNPTLLPYSFDFNGVRIDLCKNCVGDFLNFLKEKKLC